MDYLKEYAKIRPQLGKSTPGQLLKSRDNLTPCREASVNSEEPQLRQTNVSLTPQALNTIKVALNQSSSEAEEQTNHALESEPAELSKRDLEDDGISVSTNEKTALVVESAVSANSEEDDMVLCRECGTRVSPFELPEHLDFHYAQQLQKEGAKAAVRTVYLPSAGSASAAKRKREGGAKKDRSSKKKSCADISSFFSKK